jgi:uncharacterized protein YbjT (DUF2867 family)
VVRNPAKAPSFPSTHVTTAEYGDRAAIRTALTGAHTVFMVSAAETADRVQQHLTFIDAAVDVGVQRIVYVSFFGASPTASFTLARDHWATEEHLGRSASPYDLARQHLLTGHPALSVEQALLRPATRSPSARTWVPARRPSGCAPPRAGRAAQHAAEP